MGGPLRQFVEDLQHEPLDAFWHGENQCDVVRFQILARQMVLDVAIDQQKAPVIMTDSEQGVHQTCCHISRCLPLSCADFDLQVSVRLIDGFQMIQKDRFRLTLSEEHYAFSRHRSVRFRFGNGIVAACIVVREVILISADAFVVT